MLDVGVAARSTSQSTTTDNSNYTLPVYYITRRYVLSLTKSNENLEKTLSKGDFVEVQLES